MTDEQERHRPTLQDLAAGLTPPGSSSRDLWAALKRAQPGPSPLLRICPYCQRRHDQAVACWEWEMMLRDAVTPAAPQQMMCLDCRKLCTGDHECPNLQAPLPPLDPFTPGAEASAALAEMYSDLCEAGIPVASVESILGHMLAAYQLGKDGVQ